MGYAYDDSFCSAREVLQTALDGKGMDLDGTCASSLRASVQLLTKRPRLAHSSDVLKTHLKVKDKSRPDASAASSPS